MDQDHALRELLPPVQQLVFALEHPRLAPFRAAWPANVDAAAHSLTVAAAPTPSSAALRTSGATPAVLQWLPQMAESPPVFGRNVIAGLSRAAHSLAWRQTYSLAELGDEFLRNYAYTELMGLDAPRFSERLACGFLLLGAHTLYPRHRHEAEEIYVTLSGDAHWLQGDETWRQHPPGTVIHHASEECHAMKTGKQPLLALYLWRSANLHQKARLDVGAASSA